VQGWLLINLLEAEGHVSRAEFMEGLKSTLDQWSKLAGQDERWWHEGPGIEELSGSAPESAESPIVNYLRAHTNEFAPQDRTILHVLFVGDSTTAATRNQFAVEAQRLRLVWNTAFPGITLSIRGILYLPPRDAQQALPLVSMLATQQAEEVRAQRVWDVLALVQGVNQAPGHAEGYPDLATPSERAALMAACATHWMVGKGRVAEALQHDTSPVALAMGGCGLFLDWDRLQRTLAEKLARDLSARLGKAVPPAEEQREAAEGLAGALRTESAPKKLWESLLHHPNRPRFHFPIAIWQQSQDVRGRIVSPWAFARRALLSAYFKRHLRTLPYRASEYAKTFRASTLGQFREFLDQWKIEMLVGNGGTDGLLAEMDKGVKQILSGEAGPRSLAQVISYGNAVKEIAAARDEVVTAQQPLFDYDRHILPFLEKAPQQLSAEEEERLYQELCNAIKSHPVPGALFLRAAVLGLVLAAGTPVIVEILRPLLPALSHVSAQPAWLQITLGLFPLGLAVFQYRFFVLANLRKRLYQYIAAVVRHLQGEAAVLANHAIAGVRANLVEHAQQICDRANSLALEFSSAPDGSYRENAFQYELFSEIRVPPQGRSHTAAMPEIQVRTAARDTTLEALQPTEKDGLLNLFFQDQGDILNQLHGHLVGNRHEGIGSQIGQALHDFCKTRIPRPDSLTTEGQLVGDPEMVNMMKLLAHPSLAADVDPLRWEWKTERPEPLNDAHFENVCKINPGGLTTLGGYCPLDYWNKVPAIMALRNEMIAPDETCAVVAGYTRVQGHREELGLIHPVTGAWMPLPNRTLSEKAAKARRILRPEDAAVPADGNGAPEATLPAEPDENL
jgi:hypothetical protein